MPKLYKTLALVTLLTACADSEKAVLEFEDTDTNTYCSVIDNTIVCPDGSELVIEEAPDQIELTKTTIPAQGCNKISHGLYVEGIKNGSFYDVYTTETCQDKLGEVCDNVEPAYGSTGSFGTNKPGAAEVCPFENLLIFGTLQGKELVISVLEVL